MGCPAPSKEQVTLNTPKSLIVQDLPFLHTLCASAMAEMHPMLQVEPNAAKTLTDPPTKTEKTPSTQVASHVSTGTTPKPLPRVWRRTFVLRSLLLIFAPILITSLYIIMWRH